MISISKEHIQIVSRKKVEIVFMLFCLLFLLLSPLHHVLFIATTTASSENYTSGSIMLQETEDLKRDIIELRNQLKERTKRVKYLENQMKDIMFDDHLIMSERFKSNQNSRFKVLERNEMQNEEDLKAILFQKENRKKLKVSTPILTVGLPKAGTSSIEHFFRCHGFHVSHNQCHDNPFKHLGHGSPMKSCGALMSQNLLSGLPILAFTGDYDVYSQYEKIDKCFFPQINHLYDIHAQYPQATFLLNLRDVNDWISSVQRWVHRDSNHVPLDQRLLKCNVTSAFKDHYVNSNDDSTTYDYLKAVYKEQVERVRSFCKKHPSHACIEVSIDEADAEETLLKAMFTDEFNQSLKNGSNKKKCWRQVNVNRNNKAK